eukprot:TRINITY_DN4052_c0_g1_i6.p1 TRINITY_DN4052_c0_g1~~TRINITY_DN4052_c0_g1_i6.p1  ORF type:complete len:113 (-),score=2.07 TRINITY_DN4052_c0_g1_i6:61-399(-)
MGNLLTPIISLSLWGNAKSGTPGTAEMEWGFGGRLRQAHTVIRVRQAQIPRHANTTMTVIIAKVLSGGGAWMFEIQVDTVAGVRSVSYTHLRAHETPEHLVCRLLLEKKKKN